MDLLKKFFEKGSVIPTTLVAGAFVGFLSIMSFLVLPFSTEPLVDMYLEPSFGVISIDETFNVELFVKSTVPVNVFGGELHFDSAVITVESINYNTSIADLWVEKPWYSNGDGTLNFGGGTTREGGFIGEGPLLSITFRGLEEGQGTLTIKDAAIFIHDGLGSQATLETPVDALFTVGSSTPKENLIVKSDVGIHYNVVKTPPSTDLNEDGRYTFADVSIFILHITGDDPRYDFNLDGEVDRKDLGILLDAL